MLLRRLARPLFATWFVTEGIDALRRPVPHVADARAVLARVERARPDARVDVTDAQLTGIVRAHGAAVVTAGAMLALGKAPRTAALALAALTAPLVVATLPERGAKRWPMKPEAQAFMLGANRRLRSPLQHGCQDDFHSPLNRGVKAGDVFAAFTGGRARLLREPAACALFYRVIQLPWPYDGAGRFVG